MYFFFEVAAPSSPRALAERNPLFTLIPVVFAPVPAAAGGAELLDDAGGAELLEDAGGAELLEDAPEAATGLAEPALAFAITPANF